MIPILRSIRDVHYVCLQYGDIKAERELATKANIPITFISGLDFKKQIDNWFALGAACDYTISVSTALVHFMGAIGQRVELLLTERQAPFIWGTEEGQSLPYPTVNIHRRKPGESNEVYLTRIIESLSP
jgi:ADP-heptose:LPS heptosyltransferase